APHSTDGDLRAALVAANPGDRLALATRFTRTAVARVLGASPATLDADRPLLEFALDSLMAVELAQAIDREFGGPVPIAGSARDLTVTSLAEKIVRLASDAAETTGGDDGGQA